jgi:hypothetical protein
LLKRDVFFPLVIRNDAVFVLTLLLNWFLWGQKFYILLFYPL